MARLFTFNRATVERAAATHRAALRLPQASASGALDALQRGGFGEAREVVAAEATLVIASGRLGRNRVVPGSCT